MRANLVAPGLSLDHIIWSEVPRDFTLCLNFAHLVCPISDGVVCLDNHRFDFLREVFEPGTALHCFCPLPENEDAFSIHKIKLEKHTWASFSASAALGHLGNLGYKTITLIGFDFFINEYRHAELLRQYYPDDEEISDYWKARIRAEIADVVKYYDLEIIQWNKK